MNKVLVKLYIPMLEEQYDLLIPLSKNIHTCILLMIKAINELNEDIYQNKEEPMLYNRSTGIQYNLNDTIENAGIENGTELVLI